MKPVIFGPILQKRNVDKIAFIRVDQNFPFLPQSIAAYLLVQSFLLYKVCSSPVRVPQLPENQVLAGMEVTLQMRCPINCFLYLNRTKRMA